MEGPSHATFIIFYLFIFLLYLLPFNQPRFFSDVAHTAMYIHIYLCVCVQISGRGALDFCLPAGTIGRCVFLHPKPSSKNLLHFTFSSSIFSPSFLCISFIYILFFFFLMSTPPHALVQMYIYTRQACVLIYLENFQNNFILVLDYQRVEKYFSFSPLLKFFFFRGYYKILNFTESSKSCTALRMTRQKF